MLTFIDFSAAGALAYIDLGTGSALLQVMAAGLFSGLYLVKANLTTVKAFFGRRARKVAGAPQVY